MVRFDSAEHLKAWFVSDVRRRFLEEAADFRPDRVETFSGAFPGWFGTRTAGFVTRGLPPAWKQAMIVLLVLYPVVMLLGRFLSPWIASQPTAFSIFIGNLLGVGLLTWLFLRGSIAPSASGLPQTPRAGVRWKCAGLPSSWQDMRSRSPFSWCFDAYRRYVFVSPPNMRGPQSGWSILLSWKGVGFTRPPFL